MFKSRRIGFSFCQSSSESMVRGIVSSEQFCLATKLYYSLILFFQCSTSPSQSTIHVMSLKEGATLSSMVVVYGNGSFAYDANEKNAFLSSFSIWSC